MDYKNIILSKEDYTCIIKINRPDKLNALNRDTLMELYSAFIDASNAQDIRAVILTGSGEKAFVAGADIKEINNLNSLDGKSFSEFGQQVLTYIERFNKPVIAAVNGFALGGGCELALACHMRYASENAKFGMPEVNLGIIPGFGGTQRLSRIIGRGRALEMILTGEAIDSNEAFRVGLVSKVYTSDELLNKTKDLCNKIISKGEKAITFALQAVNVIDNQLVHQGQNMEAVLFGLSCGTEDFKEGTTAFLEKRKPVFKNK